MVVHEVSMPDADSAVAPRNPPNRAPAQRWRSGRAGAPGSDVVRLLVVSSPDARESPRLRAETMRVATALL
ncbi:MAG: hypothetical protein ACJATT_005779 [Myxococcota bacterium]|jgi:hypothetical protein